MSLTESIDSLTPEQENRLDEFAQKWISAGLSTERADRPRAERAINNLYALAGLREPQIIWLPCPMSGAYAADVFSRKFSVRDVSSIVRSAAVAAVESTAYSDQVRQVIHRAVRSVVDTAVRLAAASALDAALGSFGYLSADDVLKHNYGADDPAVRRMVPPGASLAGISRLLQMVSTHGNWRHRVYAPRLSDGVRSTLDSIVTLAGNLDRTHRANETPADGLDEPSRASHNGVVGPFWGGSTWSGFAAEADFLNSVCGVPMNRSFIDYVQSCGYAWTFESVVFACERPTAIRLDNQRRLHSPSGKALSFESDWGLYAWRGVVVPPRLILRPARSLTASEALTQRNAEIRRVIIERIGTERFLVESGAREVHRDDFGILYSISAANGDSLDFVKVVNTTPEPDGSFKDYILRVPPHMTSARAAVAWTFGLREHEYRPTDHS